MSSASDATRQRVRRVFSELAAPHAPLSTSDVAADADCSERAAREALEALRDRDALRTKRVGDDHRVWWVSAESELAACGDHERRLHEERDLTERLLETVPVSVFVATADGDIVRANGRALDRLGIEESDLERLDVASLDVYDETGEPISVDNWPWTRILETGEPVHDFECQVDLPNLGRRWLSLNAVSLDDRSGAERVVFAVDDVTDQKEHERRLRRQHDQTEELLRTAPIAIVVQDSDADTVLMNRRAREALGLSEGGSLEDVARSEEWTVLDEQGRDIDPDETPPARALATGEPVTDEEITIERPTGERTRFRVSSAPVVGPQGDVERVVTTGEDITELRRREQQLERRKDELETEMSEILGRISDAFYALDEEWRFTHLNDYAVEIMGRPRTDLLGREIWDALPDAADAYREPFETAMETQEPSTVEVYDENVGAWLEVNVYPSDTGLSIYFRDVSDRKEYERKLQESERRYRTLVENFPAGTVALFDEDLRYLTAGGELLDDLGVEPEDMVGQSITERYPDDVVARHGSNFRAALDGEANAFEVELYGRQLRANTVPIDPAGDDPIGMLVVQDVTERREYEQQLEASNERLEQFAYAVSHDLQEPLRMVSSYLRLIEDRYGDELGEDGQEFLEFAVDGAERMRDMIDGLLAYSRVETRGDPFEPVDLDGVVRDVRDNLQMRLAETDAELDVEPLPAVEGDADQLCQVFQNLLSNAVEYSGDDPPSIQVSAERTGDEWELSVSDEGIGMDPDDTDRVFEVFQSLHPATEHSGTGVGLAIVERIVERHGGDIWVDSEPGEGTTFTFTLPVADGID